MKPYWRDVVMKMSLDLKLKMLDMLDVEKESVTSMINETDSDPDKLSKKCDEIEDQLFKACLKLVDRIYDNNEILEDKTYKENTSDVWEENKNLKKRIEVLENTIRDNNRLINNTISPICEINDRYKDVCKAACIGYKITELALEEYIENNPKETIIINNTIDTDYIYNSLDDLERKINSL